MNIRVTCAAAACLVLLSAPIPTLAQESPQERLYALVPEHPDPLSARKMVALDTHSETLGTVLGSWSGLPPDDRLEGPLFTVGAGRFVIWHSGLMAHILPFDALKLNVFDTQFGTFRRLENTFYGPVVAVDSLNARVFFAEPQRIAVADAANGSVSYIERPAGEPAYPTQPPPAVYAADVDRLFMRRALLSGVIDVYDVASSTLVQTIATEAATVLLGNVDGVVTDAAGTRLYTTERTGLPTGFLCVYDVATGSLIRRVPLASSVPQNDGRLQFDEPRRRLLVGVVEAFDADTLEPLGATYGVCNGNPDCRQRGPSFAFVGPRSPLLLFTSRWNQDFASGRSGCASAPLEQRDADTGQLLRVADLAWLGSTPAVGIYGPQCAIKLVMTVVPATPRALSSDVEGRRVTISWTDPGNTTHFDVEAETALGVVYRHATAGTRVTVDDVPSGTYVVRVRAINYVGRSVAADVSVTVP